MELGGYIVTAVAAYLLGSMPTGFLVAKAKGIDIRQVGSGNIGATNVFRILGKPAGIFVLVVDGLKGWVACDMISGFVYNYLLHHGGLETRSLPREESFRIVAGLAAILGHNYTCWLKFKGGKGIATSAGVLAALVPWALIIILSIWIILFAVTRYVSVGSLAASFSLPFATWFTGGSPTMVLVTGSMGALAIFKHRANIQRLLNGTESRFGSKPKEETK